MNDEIIIVYSVEEYHLFKNRKNPKIIYLTNNKTEAIEYLAEHKKPEKGYIIHKDTYKNNYLSKHEIIEWVETYNKNIPEKVEIGKVHEKKPRSTYDTTTGIKNLRKIPNKEYSRGYQYIYKFKDNHGNPTTVSAPTLELIRQRVWRKHQSWTVIDAKRYNIIKEQAKDE